jgi:hypothetical protein
MRSRDRGTGGNLPKRFGRRNRVSPKGLGTPRTLAKLSGVITVAGTLAGGIWVLFQFAYGKWIEPRLSAAVVQTTTETTYVGISKCCYLYEVTTRLENKGVRDVVIHASHQVVGARRLATYDDLSNPAVEKLNLDFATSRMPDKPADYMKQASVEYVFTRLELPFLLISVGNLTKPGVQLAPGEFHISRSIAAVPKDHLAVSVRGSVLLSHFPNSELDWRWTVKQSTLEPLPMPWKRNDSDSLARLTKCAVSTDTGEGRNRCVDEIMTRARELYRKAWESDSYSYSQDYAIDFIAKLPTAPAKDTQ